LRKERWYPISKQGLRVNGAIRASRVRLIDADNNQVGVVDKIQAINMAIEGGFDLVEVSPATDPPVCRIMDYGKYVYEQKRKQRENRKKSQHHTDIIKEVRLKPETDKHDVEVKVNHAREFLEKGYRVQFTLVFRGRQVMHQEQGVDILNNITAMLDDVAKIDVPGKLANKRMLMVLMPKKI
jgi:translation initiation factor IF-3